MTSRDGDQGSLSADSLDLAQQAYATLLSVANKVERFADEQHAGLTGKQYMAMLAVLHLKPEDTSLTNIAHKLGTSKQNTQRMLTTIQSKGYVAITPASTDRRAVTVRLTESGAEVMAQNVVIGSAFLSTLFGSFSNEEIEATWRLLMKLHRFDGAEYQGYEEDVSDTFAARYPNAAATIGADPKSSEVRG